MKHRTSDVAVKNAAGCLASRSIRTPLLRRTDVQIGLDVHALLNQRTDAAVLRDHQNARCRLRSSGHVVGRVERAGINRLRTTRSTCTTGRSSASSACGRTASSACSTRTRRRSGSTACAASCGRGTARRRCCTCGRRTRRAGVASSGLCATVVVASIGIAAARVRITTGCATERPGATSEAAGVTAAACARERAAGTTAFPTAATNSYATQAVTTGTALTTIGVTVVDSNIADAVNTNIGDRSIQRADRNGLARVERVGYRCRRCTTIIGSSTASRRRVGIRYLFDLRMVLRRCRGTCPACRCLAVLRHGWKSESQAEANCCNKYCLAHHVLPTE